MNNQEKIEEILNKKFKKSIFSGYDTLDVDEFFDQVIEHLKLNDARVVEAETIAKELKEKNESLAAKLQALQEELKEKNILLEEYKQNGYDYLLKNKLKDSNNKEGK